MPATDAIGEGEAKGFFVDSETAALIMALGAVHQAIQAPDRSAKTLPIAHALLFDIVTHKGIHPETAYAMYARQSHLLEGLTDDDRGIDSEPV